MHGNPIAKALNAAVLLGCQDSGAEATDNELVDSAAGDTGFSALRWNIKEMARKAVLAGLGPTATQEDRQQSLKDFAVTSKALKCDWLLERLSLLYV